MKHIPNPSPALKKAAKDIKPGVGGYRDRIDMLKAGGVKEDVTTDMLSGRETGGHSNGLKSFKVRLQDQIKAPEEEKPSTTKARSSIDTHDNENVTAHLDKKYAKPFEGSFAESTEKDKPPFDGPYTKAKGNIKDKSGAIHTPMSRAKDLAKKAMNKIKNETMMGKISN
jgi:hypothetical protein